MLKSRFAKQQMNMLGHDHVPENPKPETAPHPLQAQLEDSSAYVRGKQTEPALSD
jgi:hypothetical protein